MKLVRGLQNLATAGGRADCSAPAGRFMDQPADGRQDGVIEFRNLISGNATDGIHLHIGQYTVAGNFIGTDRSGMLDRGNGDNGVLAGRVTPSP